jgi:hypothetical protein
VSTILSVLSTPSFAGQVLTPTPLDENINILGVRTGQTPSEVHEEIGKLDPSGQYQEGNALDPSTKQPYVNSIIYTLKHPDPNSPGKFDLTDMLTVWFSAPASGNVSLEVHRESSYFQDSRPKKAEMLEAVEKKYGKAPLPGIAPNKIQPSEMIIFGADGKVSGNDPAYRDGNCRTNSFGAFSNRCGVANLWWVIFESSYPTPDPERVGQYRVDLKDHALALAALKLDHDAAQGALPPAPAPKP